MDILMHLIFMIAVVQYGFHITVSGKWSWPIFSIMATMIFSLAVYPFVIDQSLVVMDQALANSTTLTNIALLTIADVFVGTFGSICLLVHCLKPISKERWVVWIFKLFPGILFIGAIVYFELLFFKFRAGSDFLTTAILYAFLMGGTISIISFVAHYIVREPTLKLEIKVILNLVILAIALLLSSSATDYNVPHAKSTIQWSPLIGCITLFTVFIALGRWNFLSKIYSLLKKQ